MYKLYGYIAGIKQIDQSMYEEDIIQTLGEYISRNNDIYYTIVLSTPEQDIPYKIIQSMEDYIGYINEYEEKIKEKNKVLAKK